MTRYWVGGGLVDADQAAVSVLDHGVTVGDGVFETVLVRDGAPFALSRHLVRLAGSAAGLGIDAPAAPRLREAVDAVLADATGPAVARGRLRITVTSGAGPAASERGSGDPTLIVTLTPAAPWPPAAAVVTVPWVRNERSAIAGLKTTSYAENAVALASAASRGASEALLANTRGELCEGTGSNVFVVVERRLLTPPLSSGALAGITRGLVLEWSDEAQEQALAYDVLRSADEVFLTSSTREVQPVVTVDDRELAVGPVTLAVAARFTERAGADPDP